MIKGLLRALKKCLHNFRKNMMTDEAFARKMGAKIGKGCYISTKEFPSESFLIEIGDYVRIAPKTKLFTHGGLWSQRKKNPELTLEQFGKIKIGDYTYIGEQCFIMPGVTIGTNVIVGAATVVTKSIPDGVIVAGNPMKIIGKTDDFVRRIDKMQVVDNDIFYKLRGAERRKYILELDDSKFVKKPYITEN